MLRHILCAAAVVVISFCVSAVMASPITPVSYGYDTGPYAYLDESGNDLLDGVLAGPYTSDVKWVGFGGYGSPQFDFGSVVHVGEIRIHAFDRDGGAGIYLPTAIWLYTSTDGIAYTLVDQIPAPAAIEVVASSIEGDTGWMTVWTDVDSRYLRVGLIPGGSWDFISEMAFDSIPEPAGASLLIGGIAALIARRRPSL